MKRPIFFVAAAFTGLLVSGAALASGGGALPYEFKPDSGNLPSIQRGARDFMAYCSGCHSMKHLRYSRIGEDLNIPEDLLKRTLMLTSEKTGDHILSSMPAAEAKTWFGQVPPDLSLETRARGPSWVYSYLRTFYVDPARPLGVNNLVLPGASMPHVLSSLQGWQVKEAPAAEGEHAAAAEGHEEAGHGGHHGPALKLVQQGTLTPDEYARFAGDLVNFMAYAAEPGKAHRTSLGWKVLFFLLLLTGLTYLLKKEYWKDVH